MKISISYQTQHLPPPHAYAYVFELETGDVLKVEFNLEYLNRDSVSEDEILEEGYTLEEGFNWQGELPGIWSNVLSNLMEKLELQSEYDEKAPFYLFIEVNNKSGYTSGSEFDYLLQEMIQAVYETAEYEAPLYFTFLLGKEKFEIEANFKNRELKATRNTHSKNLDWTVLRSFLEKIENCKMREPTSKKLDPNFLYISYDNQLFFKVLSLHKNNAAEKIYNEFQVLIS